MSYLRDIFDRLRAGDPAITAMSQAIGAFDPGLQINFVFSDEDAAALKAGTLKPEASPLRIQVRPTESCVGVLSPFIVAARLRLVAEELEAKGLENVNAAIAKQQALAKAQATAQAAVSGTAANGAAPPT